MRLDAVYEIISQAKAFERRSHQYQNALGQQTGLLPTSIQVEADQPVQELLNFVVDYIELAPLMLGCIEASARASGVEAMFQPFLKTALDYFLHPSIILRKASGLDGLMIRAYQCHRLVEEFYENNQSLRNSKICELESTQANLLVHYLIGEPFSNEIDESVLLTLSRLVNIPEYYRIDMAAYLESATSHEWMRLSQRWKRLLPAHHIQLNFFSKYA